MLALTSTEGWSAGGRPEESCVEGTMTETGRDNNDEVKRDTEKELIIVNEMAGSRILVGQFNTSMVFFWYPIFGIYFSHAQRK